MKNSYFKLINHHEEIFGKKEPCSFFELLFMVEAPHHISGINIYNFVERVDSSQLDKLSMSCKSFGRKLSNDDVEAYPYYEILLSILSGNFLSPLTFIEKDDGVFHVIEGKHRARLIGLCEKLNIVIKDIPIIRCKFIEKRTDIIIPEKYGEWLRYQRDNSFLDLSFNARKIFKNMMEK
jgi:hypothetical protein